MELQVQHEQMLVVRKEGKAHNQYNSFRSAFELLETVAALNPQHAESLRLMDKLQERKDAELNRLEVPTDEVNGTSAYDPVKKAK